jgi:hypothetical protein
MGNSQLSGHVPVGSGRILDTQADPTWEPRENLSVHLALLATPYTQKPPIPSSFAVIDTPSEQLSPAVKDGSPASPMTPPPFHSERKNLTRESNEKRLHPKDPASFGADPAPKRARPST